MNVTEVQDKQTWDKHLNEHTNPSFLQSWEWGEFQKNVGYDVVRILLLENNETVPIQGFSLPLALGKKFLYLPHILPLSKAHKKALVDVAKKRGYIFLRVEANGNLTNDWEPSSRNVPARQPQHTLLLNLKEDEEELMKNMHSKTRYNIRLAKRKGVTISNEKNIDTFWNLHKQTIKRDNFKTRNKEYYEKMLALPMCYQKTAYIKNEAIASNLYIVYGGVCIYLHGTSGNAHRNLMAPYLLQWEGIQLGKAKQATLYDFWGIAAPATADKKLTSFNNYSWQADHPLTGVTRFKTGFGGDVYARSNSTEIILHTVWYNIYQLVKKIRL